MIRRLSIAVLACAWLQSGVAPAAEGLGYDPHADPFAQLESAAAEAKQHGKLVLVVAGGEWCSWCHYLDAFLRSNPDVAAELTATFVVAKVYYGEDNENERFFSSWPEAPGYPHFWIFSSDGNLLRSQGTLELEDGAKSYDKAAFRAFVAEWRERL